MQDPTRNYRNNLIMRLKGIPASAGIFFEMAVFDYLSNIKLTSMKKYKFQWLLLLAMIPGIGLYAQRTVRQNTVTIDSAILKQTFMERYYEIRDTYPDLPAIHGNYAASN